MKKKVCARISKLFLSATGSDACNSDQPTGLDVCEEYAHAFRTESYNEFWTRVLALSNGNIESTTAAARLSSYRLFAEQLLDPDQPNVTLIQAECSKLLKQLESSRDKARTKLRLIFASKHGSAIFLLALTVSLTVIVASHALALLITAPGLIAASIQLPSARRLARVSTQLDVAAKGTYILNRDFDTISRLVARLNDEQEYMCSMVKFWLEKGEARLQATGEVARQLKKNDASFSQQLDDLEEHLYLCFMTINRSRNLVLKEILDPGQPIREFK
ncbi:UPF0496 protein At3g49070 isoform X2 [Mangifera indica]|uniref:UPF0496 protein At3g49070 isoform X2 n=1 Tax=Mangifera indica TaxID=29780 RepID=UPI001CFA78C9|nr:UPF0496 protein At3g49070 isoform X2 [Mangifera indica]